MIWIDRGLTTILLHTVRVRLCIYSCWLCLRLASDHSSTTIFRPAELMITADYKFSRNFRLNEMAKI